MIWPGAASTTAPCSAGKLVASFGSPSYPAVASNSARRNRSGVSRVPGVSRSIPNASKISAIESRYRAQSAASISRPGRSNQHVRASGAAFG